MNYSRKALYLWLLCWALWLLLSPSPSQAQAATVQYDLYFRRWGQFYFPGHDWHWWKAQGLAESGLNPAATSWCGAAGIMQFMPATAKALGVDPRDPESSIQGGIRYDRSLWALWPAAAGDDRLRLAFAAYNAGPGSIQRAVQLLPRASPLTWPEVSGTLPRVTGKHSAETIAYIQSIWWHYGRLR